ncbi:MAG: DUF5784 family protein [Halobacteriaceae archaeon]
MANPLRFRRSDSRWTADRVRAAIRDPLDANLGVADGPPWFAPPDGWSARRFDVKNGDTALFCWSDDTEVGYWLGNTETPQSLWGTDKESFAEAPGSVSTWAQEEFLAELHDDEPWLAPYETISWFFLPVLCSKDGRHSTRAFLRDHAMGFPDTDRDAALRYYEEFLATGVLDEYRHLMAGKLGTSEHVDRTRMRAAMAEFTVARLLHLAGYEVTPEIDVTTGHSLDYRASRDGQSTLVEVTRPLPPADRSADSPITAIRETAATKTGGQLARHGGGATLVVDCSSFGYDAWEQIQTARPELGHRPALVFWTRPTCSVEYYDQGKVPLDLAPLVTG